MLMSVAVLVGLFAVTFLTFRVGAWLAGVAPVSSRTTRRVLQIGFPVGAILAFINTTVILLEVESLEIARDALADLGVTGIPGSEFLAWLPTLAAGVLSVGVAYVGLFPSQGADADPRPVGLRRVLLTTVGVTATVAVGVGLAVVLSAHFSQFGALAVVMALAVACRYVWGWRWYAATLNLERVDSSHSVAELAESVGLPVEETCLISQETLDASVAMVRGPLWSRRLFVSEHPLESAPEDVARGLVAVAAGKHESRSCEFHVVATAAPIVVFVVGLPAVAVGAIPIGSSALQFVALVTVTLGLAVGRTVGGRRLAFEADRIAAERTSTANVREALRWLLDDDGESGSRGVIGSLSANPSVERRLERLDSRESVRESPSTPTGTDRESDRKPE